MDISLTTKRMLAFVGILLSTLLLHSQNIPVKKIIVDTIQKTRELNEVTVTGIGSNNRSKLGHVSISGTEINRRPTLLGEHDLIKTLQTSSGVVSGMEGFAGLYVRGGETDQNLYLIDGLPILNAYHFGGLFSTFNTHSISKVDFYKGVFPSSFTERASSIVDVSLKEPNLTKTTGSFTIGLISGQLYISTPVIKEKSAISLALRRIWFDIFSVPALAILNATKKSDGRKTIFNYNFTDLILKFENIDKLRRNLSVVIFFGKDNFKLGDQYFNAEDKNQIYSLDINRMTWGNFGATVNYRLKTGNGTLNLQPYFSKAFAKDAEENIKDISGNGNLTAITELKPSVFQMGMKESFGIGIGKYLFAEVGMQQTWYDYTIGNPDIKYSGTMTGEQFSRSHNKSRNGLLSAFSELKWDITDKLETRVGLRGNEYLSSNLNHLNLEPRLDLKVFLPHNSSVSAEYSRISQYAQQVSSNYMYLPSDAWLPTASFEKPLVCDIYSLGFTKVITSNIILSTEAWLKEMENIAEYKIDTSATTVLPWYEKMTFGKGLAYGLDFEIDGSYKDIFWNVAYGLMWNFRKFHYINNGMKFPAKFDNRHKIDINTSWKINDKLELTAQWEFMTGNRTTVALYNIATPKIPFPDAPFFKIIDSHGRHGIDYFDKRNNVRIPSFHRLNLNLSRKGNLKKGLTYQWDFGLYNAYCHMNAFSIVKNYQNLNNNHTGDYRRFKALSLLPILPSVSYTISF